MKINYTFCVLVINSLDQLDSTAQDKYSQVMLCYATYGKVMFAHSNCNNSHQCVDEAYALPKTYVFSW